MNPGERRIEFQHHLAEWRFQCRPPPNQHVIMAAMELAGSRDPDDLTQSAPHTISHHGVADLPRHRESNPHRPVIGAPAGLQHECLAGRFDAGRGSPKVSPAFQPLHGGGLSEDAPIRH